MAEHTELPWEVDEPVPACSLLVRSNVGNGCLVAICHRSYTNRAEANARFIALACNCHHDLLTACEALLAADRGSGREMDAIVQIAAIVQRAKGGA
jgi:hypothetical protein